jgi:hypothetical protein
VDKYRHELQRMRQETGSESFELEDGTRYTFPPQETQLRIRLGHIYECASADYERRPRPEPPAMYRALTKAKDRRSTLNKYFLPQWTPEDKHPPPVFPYNVRVLVEEGRLEDQQLAESGYDEDTDEWLELEPIPHTEAG